MTYRLYLSVDHFSQCSEVRESIFRECIHGQQEGAQWLVQMFLKKKCYDVLSVPH